MGSRNPLDIPEITSTVGLYLEGGDLASCVQVSRIWRDMFLSHRWRTVRVGINPEKRHIEFLGPNPEALYVHRHLIQDLTLFGQVAVPDEYEYPNLRHLQVDMGDNMDSNESISMDLTMTFPHLVKLGLDYVQTGSAFWEALSAHQHIRSMRLWCIRVEFVDTPRFWDVCRKLESLELSRVEIEGEGISKDVVFDRLRELVMWDISGLEERGQLDLIVQSPMLESLEWWLGSLMDSELKLTDQPLRNNHWPHLNKLHINCDLQDTDVASILQSVGNGHGNIVDLRLGYLGEEGSRVLRSHYSALVKVDFASFHSASSSLILEILCCCPRLEILRAKDVLAKVIAEHRPWVCQQLRELEICFRVGDSDRDLQSLIFERLSTLVRLEHLTMNSFLRSNIADGVLEFRLEYGLRQLASLQQLTWLVFGIRSRNAPYFPQLGMDEAAWIVDNWKNLKQMKGRLHSDKAVDIQLRSIFKSHGIDTS